jgi:hypothetical protein
VKEAEELCPPDASAQKGKEATMMLARSPAGSTLGWSIRGTLGFPS